MWSPYILFVVAVTAVPAPSVEFPYEAYVVREGAIVRAGPGQAYPESLRLRFGDRVEVYRHDPGGWCAVRPPEGAFSWVRADGIELLPNGLGRVRHDGIPSMIGDPTHEGGVVAWVELLAGELVEVLDAKQVSSTSPSYLQDSRSSWTWYKIAPPSGEFRWIHRSYLRPVDDVRGGLVLPVTSAEDASHPEEAVRLTAGAETAAGDSGWRSRASESADTIDSSARVAMLERSSPHAAAAGNAEAEVGPGASLDLAASSGSGTRILSNLIDLEIELSAVLVQEPGLWHLDDLERRAKALMENKQLDVLDRAKARASWNKIRKAQEIARLVQSEISPQNTAPPRLLPEGDDHSKRLADGDTSGAEHLKGTLAAARPADSWQPARDTRASAREAAGMAGSAGAPFEVAQSSEKAATDTIPTREQLAEEIARLRSRRFDALGRLQRMESSRLGSPAFAVVDEAGRPVAFLSGVPGVNLHRYVGRKIGVTGVRTLSPDGRTPHVFVRHVTLLDASAGAAAEVASRNSRMLR
ncbi:hypothetical protein JCM19992_11760 [Thermostilla marina]